ncbi:MAG TPA: MBOAT family O-acyltransferase [Sedimentibacter sp.]|nr:MBOAT family O-acyltransferase [Sedimentibacter sp.]
MIVFILYWVMPGKYRWFILLGASYYYYFSWNPRYLLTLIIITISAYLFALLIEKRDNKKVYLIVGVGLILSSLCAVKYSVFALNIFNDVFNAFSIYKINNSITMEIIAPIGISFYTFQSISYLLDVYNGKLMTEKHIGKLAVFISFFPKLLSGPIEKADKFLPQLSCERQFSYDNAVYGLRLILIGLFKKMVVAGILSEYVNKVFDNVFTYSGGVFIIIIFLYSIQIYCDFSAYSDIAIGLSKILGIDLMYNFRSPYFSKSVKSFWRNWHISLSTFFKDYVYIPLGGSRVKKWKLYRNILITFLISGLWHGANVTYIIWGGLHGLFQIVESLISSLLRRLNIKFIKYQHNYFKNSIKIILTFSCVSFAWIFFRAKSISEATYIISHIFSGILNPKNYLINIQSGIGIKSNILRICIPVILIGVFDFFSLKRDLLKEIEKLNLLLRWGIYVCVIIMIITLTPEVGNKEFIYFKF